MKTLTSIGISLFYLFLNFGLCGCSRHSKPETSYRLSSQKKNISPQFERWGETKSYAHININSHYSKVDLYSKRSFIYVCVTNDLKHPCYERYLVNLKNKKLFVDCGNVEANIPIVIKKDAAFFSPGLIKRFIKPEISDCDYDPRLEVSNRGLSFLTISRKKISIRN